MARVVLVTGTGQTKVVAGTITVVAAPLLGQLVTVGAQLMMVETWVCVTVEVPQV